MRPPCLAASDGRFGRRALLRAGLAAAVTAAAALLWRRPHRRRRRRVAVVTAAVTGACLELPVLAAPTAAFLVARRPDGPEIAAMAVGALIAGATLRPWPRVPRTARDHRAGRTSVPVAVSSTGAGVGVVVNAAAGSPLASSPAADLRALLPDATIIENTDGAGLETSLEKAAKAATVALGAAGGDGTISAAAAVAHAHGLPLLVVPTGTLNHFARDLGVTSAQEAVDALASGTAALVDVAGVGDCSFLNTASFGAYVDVVEARERLEHRVGKWAAVLVALASVLRHGRPLEIDVDGTPRLLWLGFIGNCKYAPPGFAPSWRERLNDDLLDVRLVDARLTWSRTRLLTAVLTGRLASARVYEQRLTHEIRFRSREGAWNIACDGELVAVPAEVVATKRPEPLHVYAPDAASFGAQNSPAPPGSTRPLVAEPPRSRSQRKRRQATAQSAGSASGRP